MDAKMVTRRCIVTRLKEMTGAKYRELIEQKAGGLLILLSQNLSSLSPDEKQVLKPTYPTLNLPSSMWQTKYFLSMAL